MVEQGKGKEQIHTLFVCSHLSHCPPLLSGSNLFTLLSPHSVVETILFEFGMGKGMGRG